MKRFLTTWMFITWPFLAAVMSSCRAPSLQPRQEFADTITHAGIIADLSRGHYDGFYAVSNLFRYGDHGLGTFDRLDGEMIIHGGVAYRADIGGQLAPASVSNATPYAVVTYFHADRIFDIEKVDANRFQRALDMRRKNDVPEAIQVEGIFEWINIRSVPAQEKPYATLEKVLQESSKTRMLTNITGIMVGYYFPSDFAALHPPGYHFHFIDAGKEVGGHVLDYAISQARIMADSSPHVQVFLPTNRPAVPPPWPVRPPASKGR